MSPAAPAAQAAACTLSVLACRVLIGSPRSGRPPIPIGEAAEMFVPMFVVWFLVLYVVRFWYYRAERSDVGRICPTCQTVRATLGRCRCGGLTEDLDRWTRNTCPTCGYDLRGAGDRCPECGCVPPASAPAVLPPRRRLP